MVQAGDLLNQCISSTFAMRDLGLPFLGLYGACSTMALSLGLACVLAACGAATPVAAITSSHFASAERQFRLPLEYGGQRPPTAQWTATAAGCVIVTTQPKALQIPHVCFGSIVDLGVHDAANMGAAMAPAAAQTLSQYLRDTHTLPGDYDGIFTGIWAPWGPIYSHSSCIGKGSPCRQTTTTAGFCYSTGTNKMCTPGVPGAGVPPVCCAAPFCPPCGRDR